MNKYSNKKILNNDRTSDSDDKTSRKIARYQQLKEDNRHDAILIWGTASIVIPISLLGFVYAIQHPEHQLLIARGSITLVTFWFILTLITHILILRRKMTIEKFEESLFKKLNDELDKKPWPLWWLTNALMIIASFIIMGTISTTWIVFLNQNPYNPNDFVCNFKNKEVEIIFAAPIEIVKTDSQKVSVLSVNGMIRKAQKDGVILEIDCISDGLNRYSEDAFPKGDWFIPYSQISVMREIK
ncbi:MAG: hypothetical protein ABIL02_03505 [candidate division WOR-3 bacterium]